jgi:hypothetical protein
MEGLLRREICQIVDVVVVAGFLRLLGIERSVEVGEQLHIYPLHGVYRRPLALLGWCGL